VLDTRVSVKLQRAWFRARQNLRILVLARSRRSIPPPQHDAGVVVSLTSFPTRIEHAWIAIETMFRQDQAPDRIVLVLAEDQFPSRALPRPIVQQQRRGLEILWVPSDSGSFDKLIPTRLAYPGASIVTVDDDMIYAPWTVARLAAYAREHPRIVVGHRGWEVARDDHGLVPYVEWARASRGTPARQVFLTGVGGVLYPPDALPIDLLADVALARRLCPLNDDIWFWAVARAAGVAAHCLGLHSWEPVRRQAGTPRLESLNRGAGQFDVQFARVLEHFGDAAASSPRGEPG